MGTECLCKTKDREESGEEDIMVGMKQPGGQQESAREAETSCNLLISEMFEDRRENRDMGLGESERAWCNMDVLVRHVGAEIDKWMFRS